MNTRFLETFVLLAKVQNFRLTAERLQTTQASVSSRIAALEAHLDTRLFFRNSRSASLTPEGIKLLGLAERIVRLSDELRQALHGRTTSAGVLRIGVVDWVAHTWLPRLMSKIGRDYPDVTLEVMPGATPELIAMLKEDEVDLILHLADVNLPDCESCALGDVEMGWAAHPALGLGRDGPVALDCIAMHPVIGFGRHSEQQMTLDRLFLNVTQKAGRAHHVASPSIAIRMVADGLGVAVLPVTMIASELAAGSIMLLDVEPDARFPPLALTASYRGPGGEALAAPAAVLAREAARESGASV